MAFYKSNSCKIGPRFSSSRFNSSSCLPSLFSQPKCPKPGWMQLLCGTARLQRNLTASHYVQGHPPAKHFSFQFSNHERILILQLFKFFYLLSQKQYPAEETKAMLISVHARMCTFAWAHLCSRSVAWISQTLTKDRRFLSSVQFSDKQMLPIVWASSRSLDACVICILQTLDDTKIMKNTPKMTKHDKGGGTNLFFYVFCRPTLHVSDEILIEVRRERRGERAGGPCYRGSGGSRGWTGSTVDTGGDVIGARGRTPLTAAINTV